MFDGLQRRQLKVHVQRRLVFLERLNNFLPIRRRNNMRHKRLCSQLTDAYLPSSSQRVLRRNHQRQLVEIGHHRVQPRLLRFVRQHPQFSAVLQHIIRNAAAQRPLHRDFDHRMEPAELRQHRQQVKSREFVGRDHQLALVQFPQFRERFVGVMAQVQQLLGVFIKHLTGIGENAFARRTVKQALPQFILQFADGLAYRRLRAVKLFRGAGEPVLACNA